MLLANLPLILGVVFFAPAAKPASAVAGRNDNRRVIDLSYSPL